MFDQLRGVQPDVAVWCVDKAEHLVEIPLLAPIIADLIGIGGGKRSTVPGEVLGQFGLDPDYGVSTREKYIEIWCATATKACRALSFKSQRFKGSVNR